jgi:hypothetical protein
MKGIELPISTIVVIILVLIVLVAIIGLFYGVWPIGVQTASLESVKDNACHMLMSTGGCDSTSTDATKNIVISNFDADRNGRTIGGTGVATPHCNNNADLTDHDNLFTLCECRYSITGTNDADIDNICRTQVCHCSTG